MDITNLDKFLKVQGELKGIIETAYSIDFRTSDVTVQGHYKPSIVHEHPDLGFHVGETGYIEGHINLDGLDIVVTLTD